MNTIDIIFVNYNSTMYTIESIKSIYEALNGLQANIIVVDNASNDQPKRIKTLFSDVTLILNKRNLGFAKAMNQAFCISDAMYIVILNPDTVITSNFFHEAISWHNAHQSVGILAPRVYDGDGKIQGSARKFPSILTSLFGRKSPLTKIYPNNPITKREFVCFNCNGREPINVDWVSGACMVVKRKAIEDVGGFDERFFLYWEDADLCKRMIDRGWQVIYYPMASVTHMVGKSSTKKPLFAIWHFHRSCYHLYKKHSKLPLRLLTPVAFMGLAARTIFVICLHFVNTMFKPNRQKNLDKLNLSITAARMNDRKKAMKILSRNGIQNEFSCSNESDWDIKHFEFDSCQKGGSIIYNFRLCCRLFKTIKDFKPNLIQTEFTKPGIIGRICVFFYNSIKKNKIKTIHIIDKEIFADEFQSYMNLIAKSIERLLSKKTDKIIAASETQRWELGHKFKIVDPDKISIINPGIDVSILNCNQQLRKEIRKNLNIDDDTIVIGSVGNLIPRKNHWLLFKAAENIILNSESNSVKFIIFGEGELKKNLIEYGVQNGLSEHIILYGWEKNLSKIYAAIDVLAHTSNYEIMPIAIIEAMAAMVPVITTGVGGVKELLGEFKNTKIKPNGFKLCERGVLCPKNDPIAFANGVEYLVHNGIRKDTDRLIKAREFVLENFCSHKMRKDTERLYAEILKN